MAKANINLPNGTKIVIEGAPSEVVTIVKQLDLGTEKAQGMEYKRSSTKHKPTSNKKIRTSPTDLILSLADGGFFKSPKDLASIKEGLAEIGHIYPVQTLSSILFKMVRRQYMRRLKENGRWVYVR